MKFATPLLVSLLLILTSGRAAAQNEEVLLDQFGVRLVSEVDAMTDEQNCALYAVDGPILVALGGGATSILLGPRSDQIRFAPDEDHLVRVGTQTPYTLDGPTKRGYLMLRNPEQASDLLNALLNGERVRMRYYMYPSYEQRDIELRVPTLAYGYGKGVEQCGWEDLGAPKELPKAEAEVLSEGDPNSENAGFALVQINGNDALTLRKQFDKFGGGCSFQVNSSSLFGMNRGTWTAEHYGKTISIYSGDGQKLFEAEGPGFEEKDEAWPAAAEAAEAAWKADPRGRMVVSSEYIGDDSTSLYGFRALWEWGMDRCGFPPIGND